MKADLQRQAANHERAGRQVPDRLLKQIADAEVDEQRLHKQIARYQSSKQAVEDAFASDKRRLIELLAQ